MQLTYKYTLRPTKHQALTITTHLELCRRQYNYRLGDRFKRWESTRTPLNACPLTAYRVSVEEIYNNIPLTRVQTRDGRKKDDSGNPLTKKGDVVSNIDGGYVQGLTLQLTDLKNTKRLFLDYQTLDCQVLQDVVHPVETSFPNFTTPAKNGNRRGKPKYKGFHSYKSLTYPKLDNLNIIKEEQNRICIDLGKVGQDQFVARSSRDFPFKTAHNLLDKCDVWVVEDLILKNWTRRAPVKTDIEEGNLVYLPNGQAAKSGLNKSILDAAQGQFTTVIKYVAGKLGKSVVFVDPKGTFQRGNCLYKGPKELSDRGHSCQCWESLDRDENSAKLLKKIGLNYESGGASTSLKKALGWREKEACGLTVLR